MYKVKKFTMCPSYLFTIGFLIAAFINSSYCKKQNQYFKIKPEPEVQVIEGGSLVLNCKIGNQQGRVQWSKDGYVFGYERKIPGYPRYSIHGDEKEGVHNLRIENAKVEDDGEYQCQVGPSKNSQAIRAQTKLTVILKPTSIEIIGHQNFSQVDIDQNESKKLECVVNGGRPLAKIRWFKNTQEIRTGLNESESSSELRPAYRSSLIIKPTALDNNAIYSCVASHTALSSITVQQLANLNANLLSNGALSSQSSMHLLKNQLVSQIRLNVLYPAEAPKITGYSSGEPLKAGTTLSLICRSLGGNPQPQLIWYRNNLQIDSSYTIDNGKESINTYTFTVDPNDHNAVYKCVARTPSMNNAIDYMHFSNKFSQLDKQNGNLQIAEIRLNVQYSPNAVKILGETEVKQGGQVRMRCVTSKANPPAELSWVVDGHLINATANQVISAANFSLEKYIAAYNRNPMPLDITGSASPASSLIDDKAGYITIAEITYRVRQDERNQKTFSCYAVSQSLAETVVENAMLNILYPCEQPSIFGYKLDTPLKADATHRLSCVVHSGHPRPKLIWKRNGKLLTNNDKNVISLVEMKQIAQRNKTHDKQVNSGPTSELTIKVQPDDNGAEYTCLAKNSAMDKALTTTVKLSVHYAPSNVTIRSDPSFVEAGQNIQLSCMAGSSNPPAELSWWSEGIPVNLGTSNATIITQVLNNSSNSNQISLLKLRTTSAMNGKIFTCQAMNNALKQTVHDAITLNIHFKPEFTNFANGKKTFDLVEGDSTLINLTISANPPEIQNRWYREDGRQIASNRFKPEDGYLNVTNIQRSDAGTYKVEAQNSVGISGTSITINVQYAAEIIKTSNTLLLNAGTHAQLECEIDANPFYKNLISWRKVRTEDDQQELASLIESDLNEKQKSLVEDGIITKQFDLDSNRFEINFKQNKAILIIHNVTKADSGVYLCIANNKIGKPANGTIQLIVKQAPVMKLLPSNNKSASDQGSVGKLSCRAQAAPNVEFIWERNDIVISKKSSLTKTETLNSIDLYSNGLISNKISSGSSGLIYTDHQNNQYSSNTIDQFNKKVQKEKYVLEPIKRIGLITMESVLLINDVSPLDYGLYRCKAENELGQAISDIHFSKPVPPDTPVALRAINASSISITLKWVPGFDGGLPQQFRLRFKKTSINSINSAAGFNYLDINSSELREFTITDLKPGTEYLFAIQSINDLGSSEFTKDFVRERTLDELPVSEKEKVISEGVISGQISGDLPKLIIIIVSVLGSSLLFLNILLVACFVRRRRKKRMEDDEASTSKAATIEMYGTSSNNGSNACATETSMSGEDEEKRSQAYSSQTDYAMEIAPNGQIAHSTGLSTYLLDDGISQMAEFYDKDYFNSKVGPDVTVNTHFYIEDPTYAEALRKNTINLVTNAGFNPNILESMSPLTEDHSENSLQNNILSTISNNALMSKSIVQSTNNLNQGDPNLMFGYASINGLATLTNANAINHNLSCPPMPPLRSTNHLINHHDKILNHGYPLGYATLAAPGTHHLNNDSFPPPPPLPSASSIGHLV